MTITEILDACRALEGALQGAGLARAHARLKVNVQRDEPYWLELEWQKPGSEGWRIRHFASRDAAGVPVLFSRARDWIAALPGRDDRGRGELRERLDLVISAAPAAGISAETIRFLERARSGMMPAISVPEHRSPPS